MPSLNLITPEGKHGIEAAECERVRDRSLNLYRPSYVRNDVYITFRIGLIEIGRWRQNIFVDRQYRRGGFDRTGCAKSMAVHRFR